MYICSDTFSLTIIKSAIRIDRAETRGDGRLVRVRQNGSAMIRSGSTLPLNLQDFMRFFNNIIYESGFLT